MSMLGTSARNLPISRLPDRPKSPVVKSDKHPTGSVCLMPSQMASPPLGPRGALSIAIWSARSPVTAAPRSYNRADRN
jgi:hypothetical protein